MIVVMSMVVHRLCWDRRVNRLWMQKVSRRHVVVRARVMATLLLSLVVSGEQES